VDTLLWPIMCGQQGSTAGISGGNGATCLGMGLCINMWNPCADERGTESGLKVMGVKPNAGGD
jgi:hypothetical protein